MHQAAAGCVWRLASANQKQAAGIQQGLIRATPLGRPGTPKDVADAAAFLCSAEAAFISGQTLAVDGGWSTTHFVPEA